MKGIIWGIFLIAVIFGGYVFWPSQEITRVKPITLQVEEQPVLMHEVKLNEYRENQLTYRFLINKVELYEKKQFSYLTGIKGVLYSSRSLDPIAELQAQKGELDNHSRILTLQGQVQITFEDGRKLFTEQLIFDPQKEVFFNRQKVRLEAPEGLTLADSLFYDLKTGQLQLTQVRMELSD